MQVTYQSRCFSESNIHKVYIAFCVYGEFKRFDVNCKNKTIRESIANPLDYPAELVAKAKSLQGMAFNQVEVPR